MAILHTTITVTTVGEAGVAIGTTTSAGVMRGYLLALHVNYTSQPATTDVTIATAAGTHPAVTLLTLTSANTDVWKYPRLQVHDIAGAALTLDGTRANVALIPISDQITVTVAEGDAVASGVIVTVVWDDGRSK
jgi:hypothetical protein